MVLYKYVLSVLETFHRNIKITCEKEVNNTLPYLDVLFVKNSDHIHTTVYTNWAKKTCLKFIFV